MTPAGARILLVEDDPVDLKVVLRAARRSSIEERVEVVRRGDDALNRVRRVGAHRGAPPVSLVLLDLNLPGVKGMEVLRALKTNPATACIPVVILSSSCYPDDIRQAYDRQAAAYITKPVGLAEYEELLRAVRDFWLRGVTFAPATIDQEPSGPEGRPEAVDGAIADAVEHQPH